jgi:integrase
MLSKPLRTPPELEQTERGLQGLAYPLIERGLASQARTLIRVGLEAFFLFSQLDLGDYHPATSALSVRAGKGSKDRQLFAGNGSTEALRQWLVMRGQAAGPLLVAISKRGRLLPRRLSDKAMTWILQDRATAAGIATAFSPHDLRRTWISTSLDAGADLATVAELAGCANIAITAKYDRRGDAPKRKAAELLTVPFVSAPSRD